MFLSTVVLIASAALGIQANPLIALLVPRAACNADNCARAVSASALGTAASTSRMSACNSFFTTTLIPATTTTVTVFTSTTTRTLIKAELDLTITTTTTTLTAKSFIAKRADPAPTILTVSANAVPTYASACSGTARFSSACSCFTGVTRATVTASTTSTITVTVSTISTTAFLTATTMTSVATRVVATVTTARVCLDTYYYRQCNSQVYSLDNDPSFMYSCQVGQRNSDNQYVCYLNAEALPSGQCVSDSDCYALHGTGSSCINNQPFSSDTYCTNPGNCQPPVPC